MAPSQPTAAVAGVQLAARQQNSLVPFFQTVPSALTQLLTSALAAVAKAAVANSIATLFSLIMEILFLFMRNACATGIHASSDHHLKRCKHFSHNFQLAIRAEREEVPR